MPGVLLAQRVDDVGGEAAVHRAVAAPQDHLGVAELLGGETTVGQLGVPHHAVVEGHAHLEHRGVAPEVLVGQEQHLAAGGAVRLLRERPLQRHVGVGGRADDPAVLAAERLDVGAGVHVGHGYDVVGHAGLDEGVPGVLDLGDPGHVGHRAPGRQVRQDHLLVRGREDVGGLGHEVHAAEDDELRLGTGRGVAGQLEGVAGDVREPDDLVALVVVAQHEHPRAQRGLGRLGPGDQVGVGGGGQVTGALDAALGGQVAPLAQRQERKVDDAHVVIVGRTGSDDEGSGHATTR